MDTTAMRTEPDRHGVIGLSYSAHMGDLDQLPAEYPLTFTREAVERGLHIEGHLLTAGEERTLRRWLSLPDEAAHAYARVIARERQPVRIDGFSPPGFEDLNAALDTLEAEGFVDRGDAVPWSLQIKAMRVGELKTICAARGLSTRGRQLDLQERIADQRAHTGLDVLAPRHRGLFQRLIRAGNQSHSSDLTKVILAEIGVRRPAIYPVRPGIGRWKNRSAMRAYESAARWRFSTPLSGDLLADIDAGLKRDGLRVTLESHQMRFSAGRQIAEGLAVRLRKAEGTYEASQLVERYRKLAAAVPDSTHDVSYRLALVLERAGLVEDAKQICRLGLCDTIDGIRFARTGRRIARSTGGSEDFPEVTKLSVDRTVELPHARSGRAWTLEGEKAVSIERAVADWLSVHGRKTIRSENDLWTTLFVLLYEPVFFADIPGSWPAPFLARPTDLGLPSFVERRRNQIDFRHKEFETKEPGTLLTQAWNARFGQRISGVHWNRWHLNDLVNIVNTLGVVALRAVLEPFLHQWRRAARGLPDLVLLPGQSQPIGGTELSCDLTFVEVKGPGDSIRDAQRWWLAVLRDAGIRAEVWRVNPAQG